ncbi:MAG: pyridoxamine 5'-phosphate oxidase family protein [Thermoproteota archaeon]|jgi:general stress protein 26|nr:pyridoxamine 5'-phosphate oxidase family protein [Thermoproteota archaeon]
MNLRLADPELKPLQEAEVIELLTQPIYLRVAMINARDGTPLVHPIWYNYKDGMFFAVSNRNGTKVQSLKKNPEVYFLVDIADRGVRGRASAKVIDNSDYATKITAENLERYMGSVDSPEAKDRLAIAKDHYSAIEITPHFVATWKA